MKILLLDIETSPNLAYCWGIWQQNISINQIVSSTEMLCWAAKWYGEDKVHFSNVYSSSRKKMLKGLHKLLDEADAVIHYNGTKFDIPHINREFIENGFLPPSPYKQIDLLTTVRSQFRFPSNKLDYVTKALGVGQKIKHTGFDLWLGCMQGDKDSWAMMTEYNIQDVIILEEVYEKLRPYIKRHSNYSVYSPNELVCPHCGTTEVTKRGFSYTLSSKFQRYRCNKCGTWFRDNTILNRKDYKTTEVT